MVHIVHVGITMCWLWQVVTLRAEDGFAIDEDSVREAVLGGAGRAKMLVLNTPHNPTVRCQTMVAVAAVANSPVHIVSLSATVFVAACRDTLQASLN